jgi:hypothetical protein
VTRDATGESWTSHHADITKLKWVPPRRLLHLPMNGRLAFGNAIYRESAEQGGVKFTQPFAAFDVEYGRARINIGANRLRGDLTSKTGGFGSFEYEVNPHLVMYADYDDFDFHKVVINNVILPRTDVDCSACDNRAFTIGLSARVGDMGVVHFGMYDINDLKAPTGSLSLKREF